MIKARANNRISAKVYIPSDEQTHLHARTGGVPLALPLGTAAVTWLGHWELQVGTATALGVCMPPSESPHPIDDISLFSLSSFRRQPKKI